MSNYARAVKYATKLKGYEKAKDCVHIAYINYFNKFNKDLLEAPLGEMLGFVRNSCYNYERNKFMYKGVLYNRKFIRFAEKWDNPKNPNEEYTQENKLEEEENFHTGNVVLEEIIGKDENYRINCKLNEKQQCIILKRDEGYSIEEIADLLNTDHWAIRFQIKQIKKKMHTQSPFNGSKLKIVKRIRRKDFEKNKEDLLKEWGKEGDWDINEYYEQMPSLTNPEEGILIKEKERDKEELLKIEE